ncbi:MAG: hypothetical protein DBY24_09150 [Prevotellaceae bacterium]|nr:MAG: hypothetical protein DBY24_09150 [Prevotellaceae bacterium]
MPKFVDINSLTEKVNPDGNEQIQVSATQKLVWKNALMNSGESIGAILSYATQYAMGDTTNRKTIMSMLGQLFYNTGSRADSFFRFVCGAVTIPGGTPKQEYFGVVFYDAYYTRTYAVFFGFENGAVPVTFFQRLGNYVTDSPVDDNFVTNIINGTSWTKLGTLDFTALLKQTYGTNMQFLAPVQGSEVLLTTTIERILYALGFRGANTNFRFLTGVNNTSETYWGVAFYNSGQSKTFTVLFGIGGSSIPVGMYQKAGNVTTQKSVDNEFIQDVLSTWTKSWSLNHQGTQGTIYTSDVVAGDSENPIIPATTFALPNVSNSKLDALLNQILFCTGIRGSGIHSRNFRFINATYQIPNTTNVQCHWGVAWYNSYHARTYCMLVNTEKAESQNIQIFQKQGAGLYDDARDDELVQKVLSLNTWSRVVSFGGTLPAQNVVVTTPTLYDENSAPTVYPQDQNNLQQLIQWILYTLGVRSDVNGLGRTMFIVHGNGNIGIITLDTQNTDKYYALIFGDGEYLHSYSIESTVVAEWVANNSSDVEILSSILENGTSMGSIPFDMSVFATKSYVKPDDAVLTMFPSGYRTVIPGENLTTNLTSGTLKIKVPDLLTAQVKAGPFRDAVIDVPYGVTVQFADQVEILYKADGVDNFTATSGRKVYTIHYVSTTSSTTNITFRAFVNVANYK